MKKNKTTCALTVLLFVCLVSLEAAWDSKRLTTNAGISSSPKIALKDKYIYVAWADDSPGNEEVCFRRSTDKGSTWQSMQRLTNNAGKSKNPDIAASGANVFLVWSDDTPGNMEIFFQKSGDHGSTWRAAQRLTFTSSSSAFPRVAVSGANVYLVWLDDAAPGNQEIYFRKSIDNGATWQTTKRLTNTAADSWDPAIAVSSTNIYVVWHDETPGNEEIYLRRSTDEGSTWKTAQRLTNNTGRSVYPEIGVYGANLYVVWSDATPGNDEIFLRRSIDGGSTWLASQQLTNNIDTSWAPAITINFGTNIYVVWHNWVSGSWDIYLRCSSDSGSTWQPQQRITTNSGDSENPAITNNTLYTYIVYDDDTPGNKEIFLKYAD